MSTIQDGKVAAIWYTLTDEAGTVIDTNRKGGKPLSFLAGAGNIIPGLEEELIGKKKDDALTVVVEPEKAYGAADPEAFQTVPRGEFPPEIPIEVGVQLTASNPSTGRAQVVRIHEVGDEEVVVDFNHPLAGQKLTFDVIVVGVREANAEEVQHGHPHGPGGHHH